MKGALSERTTGRLILGAWLVWVAAGLLPAVLACRCLYADGAVYLLSIMEHHFFFFPWPWRQAAQVLDQWPTVLGTLWGCTNVQVLAWSLGCGMLFMPALFQGLALVLLARRRWWLPTLACLITIFLATFYDGLMANSESHVAAAVFLLAAVLAVTIRIERLGGWMALGVIAVASICLYEFWSFYAGALAWVLIVRLRKRFGALPGRTRFVATAVVTIFLAVLALHGWRLLDAPSNPNAHGLFAMFGGTTYPIYLAAIAAWLVGLGVHWGIVAGGLEERLPRYWPSGRTRQRLLIGALAGLMTVSAIQHATMVRYSYPFRTLNLLLPLMFFGWLFWLSRRNASWHVPSGGWASLAMLAACLVIHESLLTAGWLRYRDWVVSVSHGSDGQLYVPQSPSTRLAQVWTYPWTQSALSFLAQAMERQRIESVAYDPGAKGDPYGPAHAATLRAIAVHYGLSWEPQR